MKTKFSIVGTVTLVMGFGFFMMENVPVGRIVLAVVWFFHVIYFFFGVKTMGAEDEKEIREKFENEEEL